MTSYPEVGSNSRTHLTFTLGGELIVTTRGLCFSLRDRATPGWQGDRAAFSQVLFSGEYDFLLSRISPGDVVLDAGANIGCFALLASRRVGHRGIVIAVEPEPSNAACLRDNVRLNGAANVIVVERVVDAVHDRIVHISGSGTMARVDKTGVPVRTTTLDELLRVHSVERIDAMKIDIEGSERYVFGTSVSSSVIGAARVIVVEIHDVDSLSAVLNRLEAERYGFVSPVRSESDFLIASVRRASIRPDLVLRLYGRDVVGVVVRMVTNARKTRTHTKTDMLGLVYAVR